MFLQDPRTGGVQKGLEEQPWQTLGSCVQPQALGVCATAEILLFSPSCKVRGTVEVSTLWEEKALEGWRDGGMAPVLTWEREQP